MRSAWPIERLYYECALHGLVDAVEQRGPRPHCAVCKRPVVLRVKWSPR